MTSIFSLTRRVQRSALVRALVGLAAASTGLAAEAGGRGDETAATVISCRGQVRLTRARAATTSQRVVVGTRLFPGDSLSSAAGASAWLVHRAGRLQQLGPRARLTIGRGDAAASTASPSPLARLIRTLGLFSAGHARLSKSGGGIRPAAAADAFLLLSPRSSAILTTAPLVRWTAHRAAARYRVEVTATSGDRSSREVGPTTRLDLRTARVELARGTMYWVAVVALSAAGEALSTARGTFTVVPARTHAEILAATAELRRTVGEDQQAFAVLLAELYLAHGCRADALAALERLRASGPQGEWVDQRIAAIRSLLGLPGLPGK